MVHLLVVDDDNQFRDTLVRALKNAGVRATGIADPDAVASAVAINQPDIVLLDMMFDMEISGLDVCRALRAWSKIPVLIISVLDDNETKVAVLDAGADDYIVKPFNVQELLARVRAIQRRLEQPAAAPHHLIRFGVLEIDVEGQSITRSGQPVILTRNEFIVFKLLVQAHGEIVSYETLLQQVKLHADSADKSSVRNLITQIRRKLENDPQQPEYILTESGSGYRFNVWHDMPEKPLASRPTKSKH
ncbi:MAG: response regulator transcription factor [Anaerolineae bacterium]|nr:response regulator transcription factor [Anaerolineae bacterium]